MLNMCSRIHNYTEVEKQRSTNTLLLYLCKIMRCLYLIEYLVF